MNYLENEFCFYVFVWFTPFYHMKNLYLKSSQLLKYFNSLTDGEIYISILKNLTRQLGKYIK